MKSKIFYDDDLEIIDTGTFIHFGQEKPVTISINEDDGTNLNIRFEFVYDKTINEASLKFAKHNNDTLKITVRHKGVMANYGYINPVSVGSFNGHELFFNVRIDFNSFDDSPLLNYTWFKGKKEII